MQTIHLLRHGYPVSWDQQLKVRGTEAHLRHDPTLAEIGRTQATRTATVLAAKGPIAAVLSSPFRAALETADVIADAADMAKAVGAAKAAGTAVTPDWRLGEVLLSTVLGSPFSPTSSMDPDWVSRRSKAGKPAHPESDRTIQERVTTTVRDLKACKPLAQTIVIVSHAIILNHLLNAMTGRTVTVEWPPCGLTTLTRASVADRVWRQVGPAAGVQHLGDAHRVEPIHQTDVKYRHLDSRS